MEFQIIGTHMITPKVSRGSQISATKISVEEQNIQENHYSFYVIELDFLKLRIKIQHSN